MPVTPYADLVGRALTDIHFGLGLQFVIIAVRSGEGIVTRDPPATYTLRADDTLVVLAHRNAGIQMQRIASAREITYCGVRARVFGKRLRAKHRSSDYIRSTVTAITIGAVRSGPLTSSIVSITSRFFGITVTLRICCPPRAYANSEPGTSTRRM